MASSPFPTTLHASTHLTESAGAVLFDRFTHRICLVAYHPPSDPSTTEYLLPKGRRNLAESRGAAALREIGEETNACRMLDVVMGTRCPPAVEVDGVSTSEEVRVGRVSGESFMLQVRQMEGRVKLIWWFIAGIVREEGSEEEVKRVGDGEEQFKAVWYGYDEAVEMLTFENDREIVRRAVKIVEGSGL